MRDFIWQKIMEETGWLILIDIVIYSRNEKNNGLNIIIKLAE